MRIGGSTNFLIALSAYKSCRFRAARFDRFLNALEAIQDLTLEFILPNVGTAACNYGRLARLFVPV